MVARNRSEPEMFSNERVFKGLNVSVSSVAEMYVLQVCCKSLKDWEQAGRSKPQAGALIMHIPD